MGICLDTEANLSNQEIDESGTDWKGGGAGKSATSRIITSANGANMQSIGKVKFDPPKVPVIFVLGGPGSGKVTHCDTLMQEKRGLVHINMMDLLQQYAIGNDMQDFSQLPSRTVTEVLMLEIKMAPTAKAYLISGYPRSMRDVVEYTEKIQVVNGVILISWRQSVLQKQIDYGAKLGHVVLSLAKMELENFFQNVMPVADYFDQSDMMVAVNGERAPSEVYKDFRTAVLDILGADENQEALLNGVAGMGRGVNDIPGSIVSVETAPSQHKNVVTVPAGESMSVNSSSTNQAATILNANNLMGQNVAKQQPVINLKTMPPIVFVIGGPGSNKATLCLKSIGLNPGWGHFSIGRLVRSIAESDPKANTENHSIKQAISAGEMVPQKSLDKIIEQQLILLSDKTGILIDGYPRDIIQIRDFEEKYQQKPPIVLLDCSKLQLGRGRLDDTVSSFRRRLELFRELTLPMLKTMDSDGRLTIVDGDTDSQPVQREFERVIKSHTNRLEAIRSNSRDSAKSVTQHRSLYRQSSTANSQYRSIDIQDLDDVPGAVPTISHDVSLLNGSIGGNTNIITAKTPMMNGKLAQNQMNGHIANGRPNFRNLLEEAESYPVDAYM